MVVLVEKVNDEICMMGGWDLVFKDFDDRDFVNLAVELVLFWSDSEQKYLVQKVPINFFQLFYILSVEN